MWNATDDHGMTWYAESHSKLVEFVTSGNQGIEEHLLGNTSPEVRAKMTNLPLEKYVPSKVWEGTPPEGAFPMPE